MTNARQSPCIDNCCLDQNDICLGCFRHLEEIKHWTKSDSSEKAQILKNCQERKDIKKALFPN